MSVKPNVWKILEWEKFNATEEEGEIETRESRQGKAT